MFKGAKSHTLDGATYLSEAPKKKKKPENWLRNRNKKGGEKKDSKK